jgi:hypothetical protein
VAYVLTLITILIAFLWATPAHRLIADNISASKQVVESTVASASIPLTASVRNAMSSVREKAMELLRQELHRSVDSLVK